MEILTFFITNWDSVLLVVAVAIILIVLYKRGRVGIVEKVLFALVSQAEKEFGSGTGELKKATVLQWIYEKLPKVVTWLISSKEIEDMIESVLEYAKSKWAANDALKDYVNTNEPPQI